MIWGRPGHRRTILEFKAYKLYCNDCKRYGNQQFPGIHKHQRSTWRLQAAVFHEHTRGISQKDLSKRFKKGKATIDVGIIVIIKKRKASLKTGLAQQFLVLMNISVLNMTQDNLFTMIFLELNCQ